MEVKSKFAKIFRSNDLTRQKYDELYDFANLVRDHKNVASRQVNENPLKYLEYDRFSFVTEMRSVFKNAIPSSFDKQLYSQIFDCYQNKFNGIERRMRFDSVSFCGFELYRRNTKNNKKGDLKKVLLERKKTQLSICMTYLARYGNGQILEFIYSQMHSCPVDKQKFYENILRCCNKFGFDRLMRLAMSRRERIVSRYRTNPIEFKSLTFSGRCRKMKILSFNKTFSSKINAFISLSGLQRKSFDIPVKFNKDYHGKIGQYTKKSNDYEYTLTFDEKHHQVNIVLCKDGERHIPDASDSIVGIDVNCKHNLFSLSDGRTFDYNRKLVKDFCKLSIEIDHLKNSDGYVVGKRKQRKLDTLKNKMVKSEQQLISSICKGLRDHGVGHVVMEDLNNGFGRSYVKDSANDDINYNRKVKFLGLSSLKNEFEHIARKYDIAVSTVHASYTSKMCPVCGCIEDENRPNQETFKCVDCGHNDNADINAALNIRNRVLVTVLRDSLLKQLDNGSYEPKSLNRDKVKSVLLSYRRNLMKNQVVNDRK